VGRLFGTNGIRGKVGTSLTAELALGIGAAVGTYVRKGTVALGRDCRDSGVMLSQAVAAGLCSTGCDVVDLGVCPTPALQYHVKGKRMAAGIVVTASHNPPEFNGLKCVAGDGTEMSQEEEGSVEGIYFARKFKVADWRSVGSISCDTRAVERYVSGVVSKVKRGVGKGLRVLVDCGNGTSGLSSPEGLRAIGCEVQTLNAQVDGAFPGHESEPTPENLGDLLATMAAGGFDLGVAHDGDADRAVFVDELGNYVSGDVELALMAWHTVKGRGGGKVVVPVDTSRMVQELVEAEDGEVIYTRVGSPVIARKMMVVGAVFGGEGNGGMLFPEFQHCRDGLMSAARMVELVRGSRKPLSKLVASLPRYSMRRWKTACDPAAIPKVMRALAREFPDAGRVDGLLVEESDHWVLFRPSGTEPIMRLMLETKHAGRIEPLFKKYTAMLRRAVSSARGR
jgi:phosphomannomutase/phosphoglucomutase